VAAADIDVDLDGLLGPALATGDDGPLRAALTQRSGLPGARLNLRLVAAFAEAVGRIVGGPGDPVPQVERLAGMLDGWAALPPAEAPGGQPAVILPAAAVASYGRVGAARPDWWDDEIAKLRRAATDDRWRVREIVAQALQTLLAADWDRTVAELRTWAADDDPLVVRAAAAGVAEPPLLKAADRAASAAEVQRRAVEALRRIPAGQRRTEAVRVLRTALGFTVSVTTAATGDLALLDEMAGSDDADLRWAAAQNAKKARLRPLLDTRAAGPPEAPEPPEASGTPRPPAISDHPGRRGRPGPPEARRPPLTPRPRV
jgi:hypothetical protein